MIEVRCIHFIEENKLELPKYATAGSAGLDLRCSSKEDIIIKPLERMLIPSGIGIELPVGYEAQVRPRSGLAIKNGITVLNSPGTIDSDYRGEIKVILVNFGKEEFKISYGDKIAQLVVCKFERVKLVESKDISSSGRGESGFGSTGV